MIDATPSDKSPEHLRAVLGEIRAELGDTVEELAHRVDVPARVRAQKEDTIARLQATKDQAAHRVQESAETVRALLADKVGQAGRPTARRPRPPCSSGWSASRHRRREGTGGAAAGQKVASDAAPVVQQQVATTET